MTREGPDADKRAAIRKGWYQFGALLVVGLAGTTVLSAFGLDSYEIDATILGAFVVYGLIKFTVSWIRADPGERKRWSYRGSHDGGGGLGSTTETWHGEHREK